MESSTYTSDVVVVGGGLVGTAVAFGLLQQDLSVAIVDGGDDAFRASRGNFGLVWVQGKGYGLADYARWSLGSSRLWPGLRDALQEETGIDVELQQDGGFHICLTDEELKRRAAQLDWLQREVDMPGYRYEVFGANEARGHLPGLGPDVCGVTFTSMDGHCNPLKLLRALHAANQRRGAALYSRMKVDRIEHRAGIFTVGAGATRWQAPRVVVAAGLATQTLAAMLDMFVPVRPNKGQVLITERMAPILAHPTNYIRQTDEGTVQIGDSMEELGYDDMVRSPVSAAIAARAVRCFPALAPARVVRTWAALRVMSPDGFPMYQQSATQPGAFAITCHSGVTLAAQHAFTVAPWIAGGDQPVAMASFAATRFTPDSEVIPYGYH